LSEEQREALKDMEQEEKVNLLVSAGLFPACGHHRVIASRELAEEEEDFEWVLKWSGVKVLCPPEGQRWVNSVRILGFYDNLKFGKQMTFAEDMAYLRREYVSKYMTTDGKGYKEPVSKNKAAFRKKISAVLQTKHSQTIGSAEGLLARPPSTYGLIRRVLNGDVEKPEIPFNTVGGATTLHHLACLPNNLVEGYLLKVIKRETTTHEVNLEAKRSRAIALAREHISRYCKKHYPKETKDFYDWDHFTKLWPTLEQVADQAKGYWQIRGGERRSGTCRR